MITCDERQNKAARLESLGEAIQAAIPIEHNDLAGGIRTEGGGLDITGD